LVIRPDDPSRFDTAAQLRQDASLAVPETGRISASGFALPRVRGEDVRFTEVYVEGMLLQDPYSGLPLVDELDLRAFGILVVHEGVPPPELASAGPIGVLDYRVAPAKAGTLLGATVGQPYGVAGWALSTDATAGPDPWSFRVYARRHVTDGKYRYYDDHGTPYNTDDDTYRIRQDNQRQSSQILPVVAGPLLGGRLTALALAQSSNTGLPSLIGQDSAAGASARTL
jgi:hypothetical protein